jgi:hypothetical protein
MWASRFLARSSATVGLFIRFWFIGSRLCVALLQTRLATTPCASLSLHLHQVVKRTFTFKLPTMLGTQESRSGFSLRLLRIYKFPVYGFFFGTAFFLAGAFAAAGFSRPPISESESAALNGNWRIDS